MSKTVLHSNTTGFERVETHNHAPGDSNNATNGVASIPQRSHCGREVSAARSVAHFSEDEIQYLSALFDLVPASNEILDGLLTTPRYWCSPSYRVSLLQQWAEETLRRSNRSIVGDCYAVAILCRCQLGLHDEIEIVINFQDSLQASAATTTHAAVIQALKLISQMNSDAEFESSLINILRRAACVNALSRLVAQDRLENIWDRVLVYNILVSWGATEPLLQSAISSKHSSLHTPTCKDLPQRVDISQVVDAQELLKEYKIEEMLNGCAHLCLSQRVFAQVIASLSAIESSSQVFKRSLNRETALLRLFSLAIHIRRLSLASHSRTEVEILYQWIDTIEGHLMSSYMEVVAGQDDFEQNLATQLDLVERFLDGAYLCET